MITYRNRGEVEGIGIETRLYKYILHFGFWILFYIIIEQVQLQKSSLKLKIKLK